MKNKFTLLTLSILLGIQLSNAQSADIYTATDNATAKTGIYDERNLLKNPGYETVGTDFGEDQYAPADWVCNSFTKDKGIRVGKNQAWGAAPTYREGQAALLWRDDANGLAGVYMYQEVAQLKPNTTYKVAFLTMAHDQSRTDATYYVRVGSSINGKEYFEKTFKSLATNQKADVTGTFTTPAAVGDKTYFSISNQESFPENYNQKWSIVHLDRMTLYEYSGGTSTNEYKQEKISVFAQNGFIKVQGISNYEIHSISGVKMNPDSQLNTGIYIVSAKGFQSVKVVVK